MHVKLLDHRHQLKHTFRISGSPDRDFVDVGILRLEDSGITAFGEASPSRVCKETMEDVHKGFAQIDLNKYENPLDYETVINGIKTEFDPPNALLAAIDMALLDFAGKNAKKSVRSLLGISSDRPVRTSFTIGIADLETIEKKVEEAGRFPILKVKLGSADDMEIVTRIRSLTDKLIRVDANQGWHKEEAVEKINWLESQNVEFVEQPLPAQQIEETAWVRQRVKLPVIADESVKTGADIPGLAFAFDGINIKLMKCGGLLEAMKMIRIARENNLRVMIGCMVESSLAISAGAQLLPLLDYADLDGFELISNDPFTGLSLNDGVISVNGKIGLGVKPQNAIFQ
ncbi:MAG: dipeptide epimerase [bacterium]